MAFFVSLSLHVFSQPRPLMPLAASLFVLGVFDRKPSALDCFAILLQAAAIFAASFTQSNLIGVFYTAGALGAVGFFPFIFRGGDDLPDSRDATLHTLCHSSYLLAIAIAMPSLLNPSIAIFQSVLTAFFTVLVLYREKFPWRALRNATAFTMTTAFALSFFLWLRDAAILCFFFVAVSTLPPLILLPGDASLEERELKGLFCRNAVRALFIGINWVMVFISPALVLLLSILRPLAALHGTVAIAAVSVAIAIIFHGALRLPVTLSVGSEAETRHGLLAKKMSYANIVLCVSAFALSISIFLAAAKVPMFSF